MTRGTFVQSFSRLQSATTSTRYGIVGSVVDVTGRCDGIEVDSVRNKLDIYGKTCKAGLREHAH